MANRPGALCELEKGKAIGSQTGFVDTFNWLKDCLKNLKAGRGIKISWPSDDTPEISLDGQNGGGGSDGGGGITNAVYDISENDESETKQLVVSYTDDRADKTIDVGCDITFNGTDSTYTTNNTFTFDNATGSNVTVNCSNGKLTIGVYYL